MVRRESQGILGLAIVDGLAEEEGKEAACPWAFHGTVLSTHWEDDRSNHWPLALAQPAYLPEL